MHASISKHVNNYQHTIHLTLNNYLPVFQLETSHYKGEIGKRSGHELRMVPYVFEIPPNIYRKIHSCICPFSIYPTLDRHNHISVLGYDFAVICLTSEECIIFKERMKRLIYTFIMLREN